MYVPPYLGLLNNCDVHSDLSSVSKTVNISYQGGNSGHDPPQPSDVFKKFKDHQVDAGQMFKITRLFMMFMHDKLFVTLFGEDVSDGGMTSLTPDLQARTKIRNRLSKIRFTEKALYAITTLLKVSPPPDPSPLISYSAGQWVEGSPNNDSFAADYSDESFKVTFDAGSTATLTFVGTSITIFGAKRPNHGSYSVALDNEPAFVGNGNSNNIFQFPLWNAQNLSNTNHTVVMTNIPTQQGNFLDIDFISIGRELGPPGFTGQISNLTIDDTSPYVVYNGSWSSVLGLTAFNSTLHSTTQAGSSVSVYFQASTIELYGLYVNAPFQVSLDNELPRELAGPNVDLTGQEEHPKTLLFFADGLDENKTHVVTLTNSVTNPNRSFYFDFAIIRSSQSFSQDTPSPDSNFTIPVPISTPTSLPPTNTTPTTSPIVQGTITTESMNGAIIGGIIGGVAGLLILAFIAFMFLRRSKYYYPTSSPPRSNISLLSPGGPMQTRQRSGLYEQKGPAQLYPPLVHSGLISKVMFPRVRFLLLVPVQLWMQVPYMIDLLKSVT
ncbi:hypothetical protein Clacol_000061 [Clathrus columnatus]|uniref:Uncharacterized protein n=1 Tax=Clathrus columnatus TaxID=1419009 RepID=A0AAV4ZZQ2_9AGAM|nr:hypothetical protein Clacol_000061 [Clathrus columnatus]